MAEIIPLTKAIQSYRERREPRFRPVNGVRKDHENCFESEFERQFMDLVLTGRCDYGRLEPCLRDALEGKSSDNIRLTSIRPWRPDDDGDAA